MSKRFPFSDVTLILPTLNSMPDILRHLDRLSPILPCFGQIIAVDSYSSDGTYEILKTQLPESSLIYQRERGLYESWNDAISKAHQPYCYISTIGDIPESLENLESFFKAVITSGVDLGLSPPRKIDSKTMTPSKRRFAVNRLINICDIREYRVFSEAGSRLLQLLCAFNDHKLTMSGSFASNLCKTPFLQNNPFPANLSGLGDVVWIANACNHITTGIYPHVVSEFLVHPRRYQALDEHQLQELNQSILKSLVDYKKIYFEAKRIISKRLWLEGQMRDLKKGKKKRRKLTLCYWLYKTDKLYLSARFNLLKKRLYSQVNKELQA